MTEEEIEELIAELLEVESKVKFFGLLGLENATGAFLLQILTYYLQAAEAQETLEEESLLKVEADVRKELGQSLSGDDVS